MKVIKSAMTFAMAAFLAACGGGGGGSGGGGGGLGFAGPGTATTSEATGTGTTAASGPAVAPVIATDLAIPNNVLDSGGTIDPAAYRSTAAVMGKDGGIAYRYGPTPADYGNADKLENLPTWHQRTDTEFVSDRNGGQRPCIPGACGSWQGR